MVIKGDKLFVTDACNHRIVVFKTDGTFVKNLGDVGTGPGQFRFPYGLDMDAKGRMVVTEFGNCRVQLIDADTGEQKGTWGTADSRRIRPGRTRSHRGRCIPDRF
jgi:DNA-binding beta-propeller fold protein YncE